MGFDYEQMKKKREVVNAGVADERIRKPKEETEDDEDDEREGQEAARLLRLEPGKEKANDESKNPFLKSAKEQISKVEKETTPANEAVLEPSAASFLKQEDGAKKESFLNSKIQALVDSGERDPNRRIDEKKPNIFARMSSYRGGSGSDNIALIKKKAPTNAIGYLVDIKGGNSVVYLIPKTGEEKIHAGKRLARDHGLEESDLKYF